eukprot:12551087-Alexandrium_andersonii.AAC.1
MASVKMYMPQRGPQRMRASDCCFGGHPSHRHQCPTLSTHAAVCWENLAAAFALSAHVGAGGA